MSLSRVRRQVGLDEVFGSSRGQGHRRESRLDSGIRDRVDCWVTSGALRESDGRGRRGKEGRRGRLSDRQRKRLK